MSGSDSSSGSSSAAEAAAARAKAAAEARAREIAAEKAREAAQKKAEQERAEKEAKQRQAKLVADSRATPKEVKAASTNLKINQTGGDSMSAWKSKNGEPKPGSTDAQTIPPMLIKAEEMDGGDVKPASNVKTNKQGNVTEVDLPGGKKNQFSYDPTSGILDKISLANGQTYQNKDGSWQSSDGKPADISNPSVGYDGTFTYSTTKDGGGEVSLNGDGTSVTTNLKTGTTVNFDANNRVSSVDYSDGKSATYSYDSQGNLNKVQEANGATLELGKTGWTYNGQPSDAKSISVNSDGSLTYTDSSGAKTNVNSDATTFGTTTVDQETIDNTVKSLHDAVTKKQDAASALNMIQGLTQGDRTALAAAYQKEYHTSLTADVSKNIGPDGGHGSKGQVNLDKFMSAWNKPDNDANYAGDVKTIIDETKVDHDTGIASLVSYVGSLNSKQIAEMNTAFQKQNGMSVTAYMEKNGSLGDIEPKAMPYLLKGSDKRTAQDDVAMAKIAADYGHGDGYALLNVALGNDSPAATQARQQLGKDQDFMKQLDSKLSSQKSAVNDLVNHGYVTVSTLITGQKNTADVANALQAADPREKKAYAAGEKISLSGAPPSNAQEQQELNTYNSINKAFDSTKASKSQIVQWQDQLATGGSIVGQLAANDQNTGSLLRTASSLSQADWQNLSNPKTGPAALEELQASLKQYATPEQQSQVMSLINEKIKSKTYADSQQVSASFTAVTEGTNNPNQILTALQHMNATDAAQYKKGASEATAYNTQVQKWQASLAKLPPQVRESEERDGGPQPPAALAFKDQVDGTLAGLDGTNKLLAQRLTGQVGSTGKPPTMDSVDTVLINSSLKKPTKAQNTDTLQSLQKALEGDPTLKADFQSGNTSDATAGALLAVAKKQLSASQFTELQTDGKLSLGNQEKLGFDRSYIYSQLPNYTPAEQQSFIQSLKPSERQVAKQVLNQKGKLDTADQARLVALGDSKDYSAIGTALSQMTSAQKAALYDEYSKKYGSDFQADLLAKVPTYAQQNYSDLLSLTAPNANTDLAQDLLGGDDFSKKVEDNSALIGTVDLNSFESQLQDANASGKQLSPELVDQFNSAIGSSQELYQEAAKKYSHDHPSLWHRIEGPLLQIGLLVGAGILASTGVGLLADAGIFAAFGAEAVEGGAVGAELLADTAEATEGTAAAATTAEGGAASATSATTTTTGAAADSGATATESATETTAAGDGAGGAGTSAAEAPEASAADAGGSETGEVSSDASKTGEQSFRNTLKKIGEQGIRQTAKEGNESLQSVGRLGNLAAKGTNVVLSSAAYTGLTGAEQQIVNGKFDWSAANLAKTFGSSAVMFATFGAAEGAISKIAGKYGAALTEKAANSVLGKAGKTILEKLTPGDADVAGEGPSTASSDAAPSDAPPSADSITPDERNAVTQQLGKVTEKYLDDGLPSNPADATKELESTIESAAPGLSSSTVKQLAGVVQDNLKTLVEKTQAAKEILGKLASSDGKIVATAKTIPRQLTNMVVGQAASNITTAPFNNESFTQALASEKGLGEMLDVTNVGNDPNLAFLLFGGEGSEGADGKPAGTTDGAPTSEPVPPTSDPVPAPDAVLTADATPTSGSAPGADQSLTTETPSDSDSGTPGTGAGKPRSEAAKSSAKAGKPNAEDGQPSSEAVRPSSEARRPPSDAGAPITEKEGQPRLGGVDSPQAAKSGVAEPAAPDFPQSGGAPSAERVSTSTRASELSAELAPSPSFDSQSVARDIASVDPTKDAPSPVDSSPKPIEAQLSAQSSQLPEGAVVERNTAGETTINGSNVSGDVPSLLSSAQDLARTSDQPVTVSTPQGVEYRFDPSTDSVSASATSTGADQTQGLKSAQEFARTSGTAVDVTTGDGSVFKFEPSSTGPSVAVHGTEAAQERGIQTAQQFARSANESVDVTTDDGARFTVNSGGSSLSLDPNSSAAEEQAALTAAQKLAASSNEAITVDVPTGAVFKLSAASDGVSVDVSGLSGSDEQALSKTLTASQEFANSSNQPVKLVNNADESVAVQPGSNSLPPVEEVHRALFGGTPAVDLNAVSPPVRVQRPITSTGSLARSASAADAHSGADTVFTATDSPASSGLPQSNSVISGNPRSDGHTDAEVAQVSQKETARGVAPEPLNELSADTSMSFEPDGPSPKLAPDTAPQQAARATAPRAAAKEADTAGDAMLDDVIQSQKRTVGAGQAGSASSSPDEKGSEQTPVSNSQGSSNSTNSDPNNAVDPNQPVTISTTVFNDRDRIETVFGENSEPQKYSLGMKNKDGEWDDELSSSFTRRADGWYRDDDGQFISNDMTPSSDGRFILSTLSTREGVQLEVGSDAGLNTVARLVYDGHGFVSVELSNGELIPYDISGRPLRDEIRSDGSIEHKHLNDSYVEMPDGSEVRGNNRVWTDPKNGRPVRIANSESGITTVLEYAGDYGELEKLSYLRPNADGTLVEDEQRTVRRVSVLGGLKFEYATPNGVSVAREILPMNDGTISLLSLLDADHTEYRTAGALRGDDGILAISLLDTGEYKMDLSNGSKVLFDSAKRIESVKDPFGIDASSMADVKSYPKISFARNGEISDKFIHDVKSTLDQLPPKELKFLTDSGVEIKLGRSLRDIDRSFAHRSANGQPGTYDTVEGLYEPDDNVVNIAENYFSYFGYVASERVPQVLRHELGHALDFTATRELFTGASRIIDQSEFVEAYNKDLRRIGRVLEIADSRGAGDDVREQLGNLAYYIEHSDVPSNDPEEDAAERMARAKGEAFAQLYSSLRGDEDSFKVENIRLLKVALRHTLKVMDDALAKRFTEGTVSRDPAAPSWADLFNTADKLKSDSSEDWQSNIDDGSGEQKSSDSDVSDRAAEQVYGPRVPIPHPPFSWVDFYHEEQQKRLMPRLRRLVSALRSGHLSPPKYSYVDEIIGRPAEELEAKLGNLKRDLKINSWDRPSVRRAKLLDDMVAGSRLRVADRADKPVLYDGNTRLYYAKKLGIDDTEIPVFANRSGQVSLRQLQLIYSERRPWSEPVSDTASGYALEPDLMPGEVPGGTVLGRLDDQLSSVSSQGAATGAIGLYSGEATATYDGRELSFRDGKLDLPGRATIVWDGKTGSFSVLDRTGQGLDVYRADQRQWAHTDGKDVRLGPADRLRFADQQEIDLKPPPVVESTSLDTGDPSVLLYLGNKPLSLKDGRVELGRKATGMDGRPLTANSYVSGSHGELFYDAASGRYFYTDHSSNGTYINGAFINDNQVPLEIRPGDEIRLGGLEGEPLQLIPTMPPVHFESVDDAGFYLNGQPLEIRDGEVQLLRAKKRSFRSFRRTDQVKIVWNDSDKSFYLKDSSKDGTYLTTSDGGTVRVHRNRAAVRISPEMSIRLGSESGDELKLFSKTTSGRVSSIDRQLFIDGQEVNSTSQVKVGRAHQNFGSYDVVNSRISNDHGTVQVDPATGRYYYTDHSTNGTYVQHADGTWDFVHKNHIEFSRDDAIHLGHRSGPVVRIDETPGRELPDQSVIFRRDDGDLIKRPDGTQVFDDRAGISTVYDAGGNVVEARSPYVNSRMYSYSPNGELARINFADGSAFTYVGGDAWQISNADGVASQWNGRLSVDSDGSLVSQVSGSDAKIVQRLDGSEELHRADGYVDYKSANLTSEKQRLDTLAQRRFTNPAQQERFRLLISKALERDIPDSEKAQFVHQINRLLQAGPDSALTVADRTRLAEQVAFEAAHPNSIDQGNNKTCNVATLENRAFHRAPAAAARLITDVAISGKYRTPSGVLVDLGRTGGLAPDLESRLLLQESFSPGSNADLNREGQRTYAGQLFEQTAVNIHWAAHPESVRNRVTSADGSPLPPLQKGDVVQYQKVELPFDRYSPSTERLVRYTNQGDRIVEIPLGEAPRLTTDVLQDVYNHIVPARDANGNATQGTEQGFVLVGADLYGGRRGQLGGVFGVNDTQDLESAVLRAKQEGRLPLVLLVDARHPLFNTPEAKEHLWHVVTIQDAFQDGFYQGPDGQPRPRIRLAFANQWGIANDHLGDRAVDAHELYAASNYSPASSRSTEAGVAPELEPTEYTPEPGSGGVMVLRAKFGNHSAIASLTDQEKELEAHAHFNGVDAAGRPIVGSIDYYKEGSNSPSRSIVLKSDGMYYMLGRELDPDVLLGGDLRLAEDGNTYVYESVANGASWLLKVGLDGEVMHQ